MKEKVIKLENSNIDKRLLNKLQSYIKGYKKPIITKYSIKGFYLYELKNNDIGIDIGIAISLKQSELNKGLSFKSQTFILKGIIKLKNHNTLRLKIKKIIKVNKIERTKYKNSLVPFISKQQFETIATKILAYAYPNALKGEPLDIKAFAKKLGLKIVLTNSLEPNIMGRIYLGDSKISSGINKKVSVVKKNTLMINSTLKNDIEAFNYTVVHECAHYLLHKRSFLLHCKIKDAPKFLECLRDNGIVKPSIKEIQAMEWQANYLTTKLLMPTMSLSSLVNKRISYIKGYISQNNQVDYYESLIKEMASYFKVSVLAIKKRLLELGYTFHLGCYNYVDNKKIPPHKWNMDFYDYNYTFCISLEDSMNYTKALNNQTFLKGFVYIDSHFVINHPKYITITNDSLELSTYARSNMDKCCIKFKIVLISTDPLCYCDYKSYRILNKTLESNSDNIIVKGLSDANKSLLGIDLDELKEAMQECLELESKMCVIPSKCMKAVKKYYNYSIDYIVKKTGISKHTVEDYFYKDNIHRERKTLIRLLLGINVPGTVILHILEVSGIKLNTLPIDDGRLRFVILYRWKNSLNENIKYLEEYDIFL